MITVSEFILISAHDPKQEKQTLTRAQLDAGIAQFPPVREGQSLVKVRHAPFLHDPRDGAADGPTRGLHPRLDQFDRVGEIDGERRGEAAARHGLEEIRLPRLGHGAGITNAVT